MSTRRFFRELAVFLGVAGGALIGYCAGAELSNELHIACAFSGMSIGGAIVDLCLHQRGG